MIGISGPRGVGKTTLLLQYIKKNKLHRSSTALYITVDHPWFYSHGLLETAESFYNHGGRKLFIDEIHKYPNWSSELKNIYDAYPDLQVVFTSSSALEIFKGTADLSRRTLLYDLPGLSFREYLDLKYDIKIPQISFPDLIKNHRQWSEEINSNTAILVQFKSYLNTGYLPIFTSNTDDEVLIKFGQIINTVIDSDLSYIKDYNPGTAYRVKKLLGVLAESVPFKPNISALARKMDAGRDSVYHWIQDLQKARLINLLQRQGKGVSILQKPDKLYLENSNLLFALKHQPNMGTVRETFALNQLINSGLDLYLPDSGDFVVDDIYIEIGGKTKNSSQINIFEKHLVFKDDILSGHGSNIPLWMLGFLY